MDKKIVDHITAVIQRSRCVPLSTLFSRLNGITKKQRAHLNKVGIEKFVTSHPNDLAIIDGIVVAVASPVILSVQQPTSNNAPASNRTRKISVSSSESSTVTPPTEGAIENIKKDIEKNNSCVVCSDKMEVYAFGICFHPICYKCSTKLRVLCSDKQCPCCRSELKQVIFSTDLTPEHKLDTKGYIKEQKYGISFQTQRIRNMHRSLLEHNCSKSNCGQKFNDFDDLKRHMQQKHGEYFCEICVQQCKIFTHDRRTYSTMELKEHEESGDSGPGSAHEGHPLCEFCQHRYLDKDELLRHLQQHHCSCHICSNTGFVFYPDITELWEHFVAVHHACLDPECYLVDRFSAFDTEDELQTHKTKKHLSKKGKSTKRLEQPIALDVQFSSRGGLQFNGSSDASSDHRQSTSRTFQLAPIQAPTVADDGSMRCHGIVVNLTSWYGFIKPDNGRGWKDNVFFNKQAYGLDEDENLQEHIQMHDRVYVYAKPSQNNGSKWRAVNVTLVTDDTHSTVPQSIFNPLRSGEDNTGYSSDLSLGESFTSSGVTDPELNGNTDSFPALTSGKSPPLETPLAASNWNKVVGTKKPQKRIVRSTVTASTSQPKTETSQEFGTVHYGLFPSYGFLVRPSRTAFEDNIYFNLQAYQEGMNDYSVTDLTKVLNINQKLCYILEEPGKIQRQAKSKYRAQKVWRFDYNGNTDDGVQPGKTPTTKNPNKSQINKPQTKQPINNELNRQNPSVELKKFETVKPGNDWTTKSGKKTTKLGQSGAAGDPYTVVEGGTGLDTFDTHPLTNGVQMNGHYSKNEYDVFRNILGKIFCGDSEDSLFEFDTELEINLLSIQQIAYIHFSINKPPRVASVLLNSSPKHRLFDLKLTGFQTNAMDMLRKKGLAIKASNNMYYIDQSSIYALLVRNDKGAVQELFIHTSFGKA